MTRVRLIAEDKNEFISQFSEVVGQVVFVDILTGNDSPTTEDNNDNNENNSNQNKKSFNDLNEEQKHVCIMLANGIFSALVDRYSAAIYRNTAIADCCLYFS